MATLFVRHTVSDFDQWLAAYHAFDAERGGMGVTGAGVFRSANNPNDVTVYHEFASVESAQSFLDSPRLAEVMRDAGVSGTPEVWITDQVS